MCHCHSNQTNGPNYHAVIDSPLLWAHWPAPVSFSSDSIFVSPLSLCRHVPHSLKTSAADENIGVWFEYLHPYAHSVSAANREGASRLPPGHDVPSVWGPRQSARPVLWSDGGRCAQTLRPAEEREVGGGSEWKQLSDLGSEDCVCAIWYKYLVAAETRLDQMCSCTVCNR